MTTGKLNIWIRDAACSPLTTCWRTDLAIQLCTGTWLVDKYPDIEDQLKERYATPASINDVTDWSTIGNQSGLTIDITVGPAGTTESLTLSSPATTVEQIYAQMRPFFKQVFVMLVGEHLYIVSKDRGPNVTISVGGTSSLMWGPAVNGDGWLIDIPPGMYCGARRIQIIPPAATYINHFEIDIPPGCYVIWTRCCFGQNEETHKQMLVVRCNDHLCVNLLLPKLETCSAGVLYPAIENIVHNQYFVDDGERLIGLRAIMYNAKLDKQAVLGLLALRYNEALQLDRPDLVDRVAAVQALAQQLPGCC